MSPSLRYVPLNPESLQLPVVSVSGVQTRKHDSVTLAKSTRMKGRLLLCLPKNPKNASLSTKPTPAGSCSLSVVIKKVFISTDQGPPHCKTAPYLCSRVAPCRPPACPSEHGQTRTRGPRSTSKAATSCGALGPRQSQPTHTSHSTPKPTPQPSSTSQTTAQR